MNITKRISTRALTVGAITAAGTVGMLASPAAADPSYDTFDAKQGWICGVEEGFIPNHCLNVNGKGRVGTIMVFAPDPRGPQESVSFDPAFDARPCPHDPGSPDGTWWEPVPGTYVCHHKP